MRKRERGQVITFYSFKGGVGRSMAVANVATIRAQRGHEVLVLDFDFEAPGLHRYFLTDESTFDRYEPKDSAPRDGVLELFYALRERLQREWPDGEDFREPEAHARLPGILAELLEDERYGYRVRLKNPNKKGDKKPIIRFLPAVRFDDGYAERVRRFDWQGFYDAYAEVFPVLARELGKRYDDVLIDSRTGVTDVGSICTMMLPDKLVLAFAPNDQGLRGVLEAGFQATQERKESALDRRPLPLFPLLSRLENSEETLKQAWIERARGGFQRMFRDAYEQEECDLETYFNLVRIPHQSFYAYGEVIAAERQAGQEMGSMAQAFAQFDRCLECESAEKAQEMLLSLGEDERREIERESEQALIPLLTDPEKLAERIRREPDRPTLRFFQATRLLDQQQYEKAIEAYDEIMRLFGEVTDLDARIVVARTLVNRGYALSQLNRAEEALKTYAEVEARYGQAPEAALREQVARALVNKGVTLGGLNRAEEALKTYAEVEARYGQAPEAALRERVARALVNKGVTLGGLNRTEEALKTYAEVEARYGQAPEAALREQVAMALVNKGVTLGGLNRAEEALKTYAEVEARYGQAPEAALREQVAMALVNKGVTLGGLNRAEEALKTYAEVEARYGQAPEAALREQVAMALVNKGVTLGGLNRAEEALKTYAEVEARYGQAPEAALREQVAMALVNKGITLGGLNRAEEALKTYAEVEARYGQAPEAALREQVARALVSKGITLGRLNRAEEELKTYTEVEARYGQASEAALRELVARALVNKGVTLYNLKCEEESFDTYAEVIHRFNESTDPALQQQVARAFNGTGFAQLLQAKQHWLIDATVAQDLIRKAETSIAASLERRPDEPIVLGNAGYIAFLLGREEEARTLLGKAILLGGEAIRDGELADADLHSIPEDKAFRALVRSLPGPPPSAESPASPADLPQQDE